MILYETSSHYYLVGFDSQEEYFRVLKIDRRVTAPKSLEEVLTEDPCIYSKDELAEMLEMVNEGIHEAIALVTFFYNIFEFLP